MESLIITSERINDRGFRLLSDGADVTDYLRNPVLLYDHTRRDYQNNKDIILPIGKVNNLRLNGKQWVGDPEFDNDDEFANKVASKYSKGYLNAASVGIEIIEISEDPELMEKGQTLPTVTKWKLKEVSITDIPANADAVKLTYEGKTILCLNGKGDHAEMKNFFNSTINKTESTMKKTIVALNATGLVDLPENATDELVANTLGAVTGQLSAMKTELSQKDAEIVRLKQEAAEAKTQGLKERATTMVEAALSAQKIVAAQKDSYITLASQSEETFKSTKTILDGMKGYESVNGKINNTTQNADLSAKTKKEKVELWNQYQKDGELAELKASSPDEYTELYKAKFGKEPKNI